MKAINNLDPGLNLPERMKPNIKKAKQLLIGTAQKLRYAEFIPE